MKTILEWFNELEEPIKANAIEAVMQQHGVNADKIFNYQVDSQLKALSVSFMYSKTSQGTDYWLSIVKSFNQ